MARSIALAAGLLLLTVALLGMPTLCDADGYEYEHHEGYEDHEDDDDDHHYYEAPHGPEYHSPPSHPTYNAPYNYAPHGQDNDNDHGGTSPNYSPGSVYTYTPRPRAGTQYTGNYGGTEAPHQEGGNDNDANYYGANNGMLGDDDDDDAAALAAARHGESHREAEGEKSQNTTLIAVGVVTGAVVFVVATLAVAFVLHRRRNSASKAAASEYDQEPTTARNSRKFVPKAKALPSNEPVVGKPIDAAPQKGKLHVPPTHDYYHQSVQPHYDAPVLGYVPSSASPNRAPSARGPQNPSSRSAPYRSYSRPSAHPLEREFGAAGRSAAPALPLQEASTPSYSYGSRSPSVASSMRYGYNTSTGYGRPY